MAVLAGSHRRGVPRREDLPLPRKLRGLSPFSPSTRNPQEAEAEPMKPEDPEVRRRLDHEPPPAISQRGWRYHHLGIPTTGSRPGETYLEHLKIHVSGFGTSPYGIEWMR